MLDSESSNGPGAETASWMYESPALAWTAGVTAPAFEQKFLLTEEQAGEVVDRAGKLLLPDAYCDPQIGGSYQTTSLYCDTAEHAVFHRIKPFRRRKHRLRRYGEAPWLYLERKTKRGERVKKRRTRVSLEELTQLEIAALMPTWEGHWFHKHLLDRRLAPVCRIAYDRTALVGCGADGPLRITFDRCIRGELTRDWNLRPLAEGLPILSHAVLCEFKYHETLPALFKEIVEAMQLSPSPASKYRTFMRVHGQLPARERTDA